VATDLSLPGESIRTCNVLNWKKQTPPDIERRPTVFLLLA
jgi:16S rRNA (cytidine1402-2'-O)-methyltransferase